MPREVSGNGMDVDLLTDENAENEPADSEDPSSPFENIEVCSQSFIENTKRTTFSTKILSSTLNQV